VGSACFVLGSVPAYLNAVGGTVDGVTYFVGSIFFTCASFAQLAQAQSPAMTSVDATGQHRPAPLHLYGWLPHDRNWLAAVTQFPGTIYFNVSTLAALTHNANAAQEDRYVWRPDPVRLDAVPRLERVRGPRRLGRSPAGRGWC